MKGLILAGGSGTRLYPVTEGGSKQLLPVYDKPMIYYPLSVLMLAGIREIMIITTPQDQSNFKRLLGDGKQFGVSIYYAVQDNPEGLAQAFLIGEEFIGSDSVSLVLGDNLFYGRGFSKLLLHAVEKSAGASIFGYEVKDPHNYGVVEFDTKMHVKSVEEKPVIPKSHYAITGIYFYDNQVVDVAKQIKPSRRGELEITSINQIYLENKQLYVELLGRGFTWMDMGTHRSLMEATQFVEMIEKHQGYKIACLEEIAWRNNWIETGQLKEQSEKYKNSEYGKYICSLSEFDR
jgi:glucose-1-phosphate thymidylyltransferase